MEAYFDRSLVLTFAIPKEQLKNRIPSSLTLDTFEDKWAFVAVAMVQTRQLRPKGFPKFLGNDFFLIGYRVFVRYQNLAGKNLRGLYILKSETDNKKMQFLGNIFTHYNYSTTDINIEDLGNTEVLYSDHSNFKVNMSKHQSDVVLPLSSPFDSWKDARRFSGPLPFTFTCSDDSKSVLIIEGVRSNWKPQPVNVLDQHFAYLDQSDLKSAVLASAFEVRNVPYYWKKGLIETWP